MLSQNVMDPREFLTDAGHGESVWDSQQNSQVWSYSQSSNSQYGYHGGNSQGNHRNNSNPRSGSDYWSQSQNVSEPMQENEDDGRYHLKYLNKPPLFSKNKKTEEKQPMKSFHQYVELQKKKSADDETRSKLDSILKFLQESSEEQRSCIGALKSELATEFEGLSESVIKESNTGIQKLTEEIRQYMENQKKVAYEEEDKASNQVIKLKLAVEERETLISQLKSEIAEAKEREKILLEKESTYQQTMEEKVDTILSQLVKQVIRNDAAVQTTTEDMIQCATQTTAKESNDAETNTNGELMQSQNPSQSGLPNRANWLHQDGQDFQYPLLPNGCSQTVRNMAYNNSMGVTPSVPTPDISRLGQYPIITQDGLQTSTVGHRSTEPRPLSHYQVAQRMPPLYNHSPAQRASPFTNMPKPSPIATVAPMIQQAPKVKDEDTSNKDSCLYNVKRPKTRRTPLANKKDDPSSIFFFDISSETDSSEDASQEKENQQQRKTSPVCESPLQQKLSEGNAVKTLPTNFRNSFQKPITDYGTIKKDNSLEWVKNKAAKRSPFTLNTNGTDATKSKIANKPQLKAKTRVTSRGNLAKMRKEYAEMAFKFSDDVDLKTIQMAFKKHTYKA